MSWNERNVAEGRCLTCGAKHNIINPATGRRTARCAPCGVKFRTYARDRARKIAAAVDRVREPTLTRFGMGKARTYHPTVQELRFVEIKLSRIAMERRLKRWVPPDVEPTRVHKITS